ncbi:MAG: hypothetical protein LBU44_00320 [Mediterranea sp.]|jgi:hypothetical protein|nr:hypothetical protein [Mediterranea sp.]
MKKHIFLIGLFGALLCATNATAQNLVETEMTAAEKNAAKMTEKEAKRAEKEEAAAAKELEKLSKAEAKAERKQEKRDKNQEKFDAFMEKWEPVEISTADAVKMPNTAELFIRSNMLFATMKEVQGYIDYIQVEALPENEEGIVEMKITNKNTGEDISKNAALETYAKATLDLASAAVNAVNMGAVITSALSEVASNPVAGIKLGKKAKDAAFAVKYSIDAIPLIKAKIQDNIDAVKQIKNN